MYIIVSLLLFSYQSAIELKSLGTFLEDFCWWIICFIGHEFWNSWSILHNIASETTYFHTKIFMRWYHSTFLWRKLHNIRQMSHMVWKISQKRAIQTLSKVSNSSKQTIDSSNNRDFLSVKRVFHSSMYSTVNWYVYISCNTITFGFLSGFLKLCHRTFWMA